MLGAYTTSMTTIKIILLMRAPNLHTEAPSLLDSRCHAGYSSLQLCWDNMKWDEQMQQCRVDLGN